MTDLLRQGTRVSVDNAGSLHFNYRGRGFSYPSPTQATMHAIKATLGDDRSNLGELPTKLVDLLDDYEILADRHDSTVFTEEYWARHARTVRFLTNYERKGLSASEMLRNLYEAHVVVIGIGGVGSWIASHLLTMGVGNVTGVDGDVVDSSNLNRTCVYAPEDIGREKIAAFDRYAKRHFPSQRFKGISQWINSSNDVSAVCDNADFVVSAADTPHRIIREWVRSGAQEKQVPVVETMGGRIGPVRGPGGVAYERVIGPVSGSKDTATDITFADRGPGVPIFHPLADATGVIQAIFMELTGCEQSCLRDGYIAKSPVVSLGTFRGIPSAE